MSKAELVEKALEKIGAPEILINMVSKRVRQIGLGACPLIYVTPRMSYMEVALQEIIQGKLAYESLDAEPANDNSLPKVTTSSRRKLAPAA